MFLRYVNNVCSSCIDSHLEELIALQNEIGKDNVWIFPAYPNDRNSRIRLIGKIYIHVTHAFNLGFKGLFMGYHDGKSFFSLDFSLHGEKGKNKNRPYGLSASQIKNRYSKKRGKSDKGKERVNEYF